MNQKVLDQDRSNLGDETKMFKKSLVTKENVSKSWMDEIMLKTRQDICRNKMS